MGLDVINVIRNERGLTIEQLADKSGVPLNTLKKICAGISTNPTLDTMKAIAKGLECSLDDFVEEGEQPRIAAAHSEIKKEPATSSRELTDIDKELVTLLRQLTPEQAQRAIDFVQGLLASR